MIRVPGALALIVSFIAAASAAPAGTPCPSLKALTIPAVTITSASALPAGPFSPPGSRSPMMLPAFCRIEGVARPVTDSEIKFEVWIPTPEAWNGKFQGVGNGTFTGEIQYGDLMSGIRGGYATISSDTGHKSDGDEQTNYTTALYLGGE